jgi:transcriptional regulator GlxA family with amidase domain
MFVMLAGGQATAHFRALAERLGPVATFPASSSVIRCLVALYDEVRRNPDLDEFSASEHAYRFLMHLYRHAAASDAAVPPPERVSAILSWLRTHATEPITLDHIAEASGISKYHLVRLLKRHTGLTPAQHVTRIRVERAAELLRHASLTVQEIAERVGYPSGNYLIKVFRRVVGVTPGQYRDSAGIERIDFLRVR